MSAHPSMRSAESGFVLVGVVMFVLALGILGLSLFSLSSYEAGFFQRALDEERATQRAAGGVELVKKLIAMQPYSMNQAKTAEGRLGIISARAWQINGGNIDSTSVVDWTRHVFMLVRTRVGQSVHTVEGEFVPAPGENPYKRLITSNGLIFYNATDNDGVSRSGTTVFERLIWQTVTASTDTAWMAHVTWTEGRPLKTSPAPVPEVGPFLAAHLNGGLPQVTYSDSAGPEQRLEMTAGSDNGLAFFRSPPMTASAKGVSPEGQSYTFFTNASNEMVIRVRGTCVWMLPAGIRFNGRVKVEMAAGADPDGTHNLVIVSAPNGRHLQFAQDYRDVGIWMFDGLDIDSRVRVFLVTDGTLRLEQYYALTTQSNARGLSIFADGVFLMGPRAGSGVTLFMRHRISMDARADQLTSLDAVPTWGGSATSRFALIPGSWREQ